MTNYSHTIDKVAVVGAGLIGMSWASLFMAKGLRVIVIDPRAGAERAVEEFADKAMPHLRALDPAIVPAPHPIQFSTDIGAIRQDVKFVQESAVESLNEKQKLVGQLEELVDQDVIIASSTSSLKASDIQAKARRPGRILVAHPMNPPHLLPLVELVGGKLTDPDAILAAEAFYQHLGKVTIKVGKEVIGHLANRLTSALYREAVHLVADGVASVEDVDRAISYGPGIRWALIGPHLGYHLGGGEGGYRHYLDHLGATQEARWRDQRAVALTDEVKDRLVAGIEEELQSQESATLVQRRDDALVEILKLKRKSGF